jgi:hypothetical protein
VGVVENREMGWLRKLQKLLLRWAMELGKTS